MGIVAERVWHERNPSVPAFSVDPGEASSVALVFGFVVAWRAQGKLSPEQCSGPGRLSSCLFRNNIMGPRADRR